MSRQHDGFTHAIEAWLDESELPEDPASVLDRVVAQLDLTPQRRFSLPVQRIPFMNNAVRVAIASAAVVVVALLSIGLLRPAGGIGGPPAPAAPSATQTATPTTSAQPSQSPEPADVLGEDCCLGRGIPYSVTVGGVSLSFVAPNWGWESHHRPYISKSTGGPQGADAIIYWAAYPDSLSSRSCSEVLDSSVGPTAADLAAAVATAEGTELVSGPSVVPVDDRPALHIVISVLRPDAGCMPGFFFSWEPFEMGAFWPDTMAGDTIRVWIVDVDGTRIFIAGATHPRAGERVELEIQQFVDSIRFE